jgi:hypothetical protein
MVSLSQAGERRNVHTYQMRPPQLIHRLCIVQLDVQILVYTLECPADLDFVLEFDRDFVLDERFEEAIALSVACASLWVAFED